MSQPEAPICSSEMNVYTPGDFYRTPDGKKYVNVDIAGTHVTLPVENVGTSSTEVWVAFVNVKDNSALAAAAKKGLRDRLVVYLEPTMELLQPEEYVTLISPPSSKTEGFFSELYAELKEIYGDHIQLVQLPGGAQEREVAERATSGIVLPCDSILKKVKGEHKFIGATQEQATTIKNSKLVIRLDDISTTGETVHQTTELVRLSKDNAETPIIHFYVIGTEATWDPRGLQYPKKFPANIHAFFQIPEVVGALP